MKVLNMSNSVLNEEINQISVDDIEMVENIDMDKVRQTIDKLYFSLENVNGYLFGVEYHSLYDKRDANPKSLIRFILAEKNRRG